MSRLLRHIDLFESIERDSDMLSGSKLKMIQVLFESLCASLSAAQGHGANKAVERKLQALSRAQKILKGLQLTLNEGAQPLLGSELGQLYAYMAKRLWQSNLHQDLTAIDEVLSLARILASAWQKLSQPIQVRADFPVLGAAELRGSVSYLA